MRPACANWYPASSTCCSARPSRSSRCPVIDSVTFVRIVEIAAVSGDLVWMLAAAAVSLVLALRLRSVLRARS